MKKLLLVFAMLTGLISFSFAQTPAAKPAAAPAASNGIVLKKDGTPDKRYKSTPATTGPVKKDGTPDKRYKANKKN